ISVVQTAVLLAIAVILGQWAARKLGLGTPLIEALLAGRSVSGRLLSTLLVALALGIATAVALMMLDHWIFAPAPAVAELIHNAESGSTRPSTWKGLLASFYGAITEEILMRLGLLSLLALAFRSLARMCGASRELGLPTHVFWAANIATAVLFGLGHLPATAALAPLSVALVVRAVVLNGTAGLVFGVCTGATVGVGGDLSFWRRCCRPSRPRRLEATDAFELSSLFPQAAVGSSFVTY